MYCVQLETFPGVSGVTPEGLANGVIMADVLCIMYVATLFNECQVIWTNSAIFKTHKLKEANSLLSRFLHIHLYLVSSIPEINLD